MLRRVSKLSILTQQFNKFPFANLNSVYSRQPNRDAFMFVNQQTKWTHNQLNIQTTSFVRGLKQKQFMQNDSLLVRLSPQQQMQKLILKVCAANMSLNLFESKAQSLEQLSVEIKKSQARAFIFDSYSIIGKDDRMIETLYYLMPKVRKIPAGQSIILPDYRYLRYLIHTDYYPFSGTVKFKDLLNYSTGFKFDIFFECKQQAKIQLSQQVDKNRPIFITNPLDGFVFESAIINTMENGRMTYCVQKQLIPQLASTFNHQIDYVGTEQVQLNMKSRAYIPRGSNLFKGHPNRFQI